jgi:hypothetical protein
MNDDPKKYIVEEYKDVSNNVRHYGTMRFAQLTLFVAISGALIVLAFKPLAEVSYGPRRGIRIAGLVITAVFWILEQRSTVYWIRFKERALYLEEKLGYDQYHMRPRPLRLIVQINATNALRLLFISCFIFWLVHWARGW